MNPNPTPGAPAGSTARDALNVPSILIIISGAMGILGTLSRMVTGAQVGDITSKPQYQELLQKNPEAAETLLKWVQILTGPLFTVGNLLVLALSGFAIFGAIKMRNLQSHGLAVGALIASLFPCTGCCCLGVPVGIWALTVLMKPEVKSQFQG